MMNTRWVAATAAFLVLSDASPAAAIRVYNYSDDGLAAAPIASYSGVLLTTGSGAIAVGAFATLTDSALSQAMTSPAAWAAVLADFIAYADTKANPIKIGDGVGISGLYDADKGQPIPAASPLVGRTIYTIIGNGATLETSTQMAIIKEAEVFSADAPVFQATANPSEQGSTIILGSLGPAVAIPELGGSFAVLRLSIPEPGVVSLGLIALGTVCGCRRRRNV